MIYLFTFMNNVFYFIQVDIVEHLLLTRTWDDSYIGINIVHYKANETDNYLIYIYLT